MPSAFALRANSSSDGAEADYADGLPSISKGASFCQRFCFWASMHSGNFFASIKMQARANSENTVPWMPLEPVT